MKKFIALVLAIMCLAAMTTSAFADTSWPDGKTIQMIIPFGAGGDTDLHCRVLTEMVAKELGTDIVCTNVTGTSGTVAARQVKDTPADGYTVMWQQTSFFIASLLGVCDFDYTAFDTASTVIEDMSAFVVVKANNGKYSNFDEFVQYAKDHPGELLWGGSIGGDGHLYTLMMAKALGLEFTYVDLDGTAEIIPAMLNGSVDFTMGVYGTYGEYVKSGDFDALCYLADKSLDGSEVPGWKEYTGESFPIGKMFGYFFPKGTDPEIIAKFNAAVEKCVNSDEFKAHCEKYFINPIFRDGDDAAEYLKDYYASMTDYRDSLVVG